MARTQLSLRWAWPLVIGAALIAAPSSAGGRVWPDLKALDAVDSPEITYVQGIPVMVRAVRVKEKPQQLLQLFVDTFYKAGLFVPVGEQQVQLSQHPMLTAYDPRRQVSYTVIFQTNPDGTTTLLLGESHLAEKERRPTVGQASVPLFPGAREPMTVHQEGAEIVTYRVTAGAAELLRFYGRALAEAGFTAADDGTPGVFVRGATQVQVSTEARGPELSVVVVTRGAR